MGGWEGRRHIHNPKMWVGGMVIIKQMLDLNIAKEYAIARHIIHES